MTCSSSPVPRGGPKIPLKRGRTLGVKTLSTCNNAQISLHYAVEIVRSIGWRMKLLVPVSDTQTKLSIPRNTSLKQSSIMAGTERGAVVVPGTAI